MAWAISDYTKRVENRPWRPWHGVTHVAIHAGQTWHRPHVDQIEETFDIEVPTDLPQGCIVAVAKIAGCVMRSDDPWFSGPYGWLLSDVVKVQPIECTGSRGLWKLPELIHEQLIKVVL